MATTVVTSNKNNMIQVFRALAILLVVTSHTCPLGACQYLLRPLINTSVATFLFLSGYLTKTENGDWGGFFKKRIFRVAVPYLIWTALYTLTDDVKRMPFNLLTASAASQLYFIFVYIQCVLLTPLLGRLARSRYQAVGWIITPVAVILFSYLKVFHVVDYPSIVGVAWWDSFLGWLTYYYLGLVLGNRIIVKHFSLRTLVVFFLLSMVLQIGEGYGWHLYGEVDCGTLHKLSTLLTSSLFLLIIHTVLERGMDVKNKLIRQIGDYSFGIYLCHILVMLGLMQLPHYNVIPFPVNSVILLFASYGACLLVHKLCGNRISRYLGVI